MILVQAGQIVFAKCLQEEEKRRKNAAQSRAEPNAETIGYINTASDVYDRGLPKEPRNFDGLLRKWFWDRQNRGQP